MTELSPDQRASDQPGGDGAAGAGLTYADSGVDIDAGDESARRILGHLRRTQGPRVIDNAGGFAGLFRLDYNEKLFKRNYRDPVLVAQPLWRGLRSRPLGPEHPAHPNVVISPVFTGF